MKTKQEVIDIIQESVNEQVSIDLLDIIYASDLNETEKEWAAGNLGVDLKVVINH